MTWRSVVSAADHTLMTVVKLAQLKERRAVSSRIGDHPGILAALATS